MVGTDDGGGWRTLGYRATRAVLVAGVAGFLVTQGFAVLNEIWYEAGAAGGTNPGAFGKVEPLGFAVFSLLAPALALVPLPARRPRWALGVRSLLFGGLAWGLGGALTAPVSWVQNVGPIAGVGMAVSLFVWGWADVDDGVLDPDRSVAADGTETM